MQQELSSLFARSLFQLMHNGRVKNLGYVDSLRAGADQVVSIRPAGFKACSGFAWLEFKPAFELMPTDGNVSYHGSTSRVAPAACLADIPPLEIASSAHS